MKEDQFLAAVSNYLFKEVHEKISEESESTNDK